MQALGDEDGARDAEVVLAGDETRAAEVGGCADALEHGGEPDEGLGVFVGEVVCACCDGGGAGRLESGGQVLHVELLVVDDVFEVVVVGLGEAGGEEGGCGEFGDATFVEDVFQMLKGQGVLENVDISDGTLFHGSGQGGRGEQKTCCRGGGESHRESDVM